MRPALVAVSLIDQVRMNVTLVDAGNVVLPVSQSDASAIPPEPASKGGDATAGTISHLQCLREINYPPFWQVTPTAHNASLGPSCRGLIFRSDASRVSGGT